MRKLVFVLISVAAFACTTRVGPQQPKNGLGGDPPACPPHVQCGISTSPGVH